MFGCEVSQRKLAECATAPAKIFPSPFFAPPWMNFAHLEKRVASVVVQLLFALGEKLLLLEKNRLICLFDCS